LPDTKLNKDKKPAPHEEEPDKLAKRVSELEELTAQKEETLAIKESRIAELKEALASKGRESDELKQSLVEFNNRIHELEASLKEAIANYKAQTLKANPEIPEELISGESIEEVNSSLASAKELVSKVRKGIEVESTLFRFPPGAPERTPPDLSGLSPREKIQYAIGGKK